MTKFRCVRSLRDKETKAVVFIAGKTYEMVEGAERTSGYVYVCLMDELGKQRWIEREWMFYFRFIDDEFDPDYIGPDPDEPNEPDLMGPDSNEIAERLWNCQRHVK